MQNEFLKKTFNFEISGTNKIMYWDVRAKKKMERSFILIRLKSKRNQNLKI